MNQQSECNHYSLHNNGVKKILQIWNYGYKIQHLHCEVFIQETWITWWRIVYWSMMSSSLFNIIEWCTIFYKYTKKTHTNHLNLTLWLSYWKKITIKLPRRQNSRSDFFFLNTQIYVLDGTIPLCSKYRKFALNNLFFSVWIRTYSRCW